MNTKVWEEMSCYWKWNLSLMSCLKLIKIIIKRQIDFCFCFQCKISLVTTTGCNNLHTSSLTKLFSILKKTPINASWVCSLNQFELVNNILELNFQLFYNRESKQNTHFYKQWKLNWICFRLSCTCSSIYTDKDRITLTLLHFGCTLSTSILLNILKSSKSINLFRRSILFTQI